MKLLLVGAGRMGSALLRGWIASQTARAIHVVEPNPSPEIRQLAEAAAIVLKSDLSTVPAADAAVIALKPQTIRSDGDSLGRLGSAAPLVISIAAGVTTGFLSSRLGPRARVIRAMPNTPGAIGHGITALYASANADASDRERAVSLMAGLGQTVWIGDESLMDAVTAVSGSGPAYVFLLGEALAAAGRAQGLDAETADRLARFTIAGSGALMTSDPRPLSELRRDVMSPGGTTEAALNVLMSPDGLSELIGRAVAAAAERGRALGKGG